MFGEMIGLWMAAVWRQMGEPADVRVVELGPGRGTLMADALRAAKRVPGFLRARSCCIWSRPARRCSKKQESRLDKLGVPVLWHDTLDEVPAGPSIVIANEFFDALPIRQAVKADDGWCERMIDIGAGRRTGHYGRPRSAAAFRRRSAARLAGRARSARSTNGAPTIWRSSSARRIAARAARPWSSTMATRECGLGETLQAVGRASLRRSAARAGRRRSHRPCRFRALGQCAESMGARSSSGRSRQREFLRNLGIETPCRGAQSQPPRAKPPRSRARCRG